jgi:2-amino-4-hydroxy-6-hydroxymethyldihydropteridine diphosphokinase
MGKHTAYIGLGANLGDAQAQVRHALGELGRLPHTQLLAASSLYRSAPIDSSGDDYINAVATLQTELAPHALLRALQRIEQAAGRKRPYPNAPRTLDLDLLMVDELCLSTAELTLPHPRLHERAFVLVPLAALAPGLVVPKRGAVTQLLAQVAHQACEKIAP